MASIALTRTVLPPALEASWLNEENDRSFQDFKNDCKVDDVSHVSLSECCQYTVDASLASNTRCVYLTCLDVPTQDRDTFFAYLDAKQQQQQQQQLASRLAAAETSKSVRAILGSDIAAFNHVRKVVQQSNGRYHYYAGSSTQLQERYERPQSRWTYVHGYLRNNPHPSFTFTHVALAAHPLTHIASDDMRAAASMEEELGVVMGMTVATIDAQHFLNQRRVLGGFYGRFARLVSDGAALAATCRVYYGARFPS